jgi:hypothetical protein
LSRSGFDIGSSANETATMTDRGATGPTDPRVEWLAVRGDREVWRSLGLHVTADGLIPLVGTSIRLVDDPLVEPESGLVGWALSGTAHAPSAAAGGAPSTVSVDGLSTDLVAAGSPIYAEHPLAASGLDHVVVLTADLERTSEAIAAATGCELKRIREVGTMRQGFHRIGRGGLIVELVERPDLPDGPASFWGLVLIVDDLDAACELIGPDRISAPKDAVQPGRRIATVRGDVGLGLPLALMSH